MGINGTQVASTNGVMVAFSVPESANWVGAKRLDNV